MTKRLGFVTMRAQPLHDGHKHLIREAAKQCDQLLILLGSANLPRTIQNPFSFQERKSAIVNWITSEFSYIGKNKFSILPVNTYVYSDSQWISDVTNLVEATRKTRGFDEAIMFGHMKAGNEYLKWFPNFKSVNIESDYDISATQIRRAWFKDRPEMFDPDVISDYEYFQKEKVIFGNYPYPSTLNFCCADAILECAGQVLLIQRKFAPGRNNWALPGGFKENRETFMDCALRELIEETNVRVPEKVLRGSIVNTKIFDSPFRGSGIPRLTMAVHIKINVNPDGSLPRAHGTDDAMLARWWPLQDVVNSIPMHDDHAGIISDMCKVMPVPAHMNKRYAE